MGKCRFIFNVDFALGLQFTQKLVRNILVLFGEWVRRLLRISALQRRYADCVNPGVSFELRILEVDIECTAAGSARLFELQGSENSACELQPTPQTQGQFVLSPLETNVTNDPGSGRTSWSAALRIWSVARGRVCDSPSPSLLAGPLSNRNCLRRSFFCSERPPAKSSTRKFSAFPAAIPLW